LVLLDTSASMQRGDLWPQAVRQAEAAARSVTQPNDNLAIYRFERTFEPVLSFEEWTAAPPAERSALVQQRLEMLKPGWGDTDLGRALLQAAEVLEEAVGRAQAEGLRKQIVVISDLAEGSRLAGLQGYEWPEGLDVTPVQVRVERPTNAGLQAMATEGEAGKYRVRISNASDSSREQFQLSWANGGQPVGPLIDVYVPPGRSRVVEAPAQSGTTLLLKGDDYPFDNTAYVAPASTLTVPVIYLGRDTETEASGALYYLRRAFQQSGRREIKLITGSNEQVTSSPDFERAPLIIVTDVPGPEMIDRLKQRLEAGKTILWVMQKTEAAPALATLLGVPNLRCEEGVVADYAMLGRIDFQHPLFAAFADPRYSDFTKIHVWKYRRLDFSGIPAAREVVRFDVGDPAWMEIKAKNGTVHVLATSWRPTDSQLGLSSKFVPLLYLLFEQSGGPTLQPALFTVGDSIALTPPEGTSPLNMRLPDGTQRTLTNTTQFANTALPGLYQAFTTGHTQLFAVNISADESRTAPMELERLEQLGVPLRSVVIENEKRAAEQRAVLEATELENRQKLWRWLLAAAVVILFAESWLAGRLSRSSSEPAPATS
jgi:hypothetical protein